MKYAILGPRGKKKHWFQELFGKFYHLTAMIKIVQNQTNKGQMTFLIDVVYSLKQLKRTIYVQTQRGYIVSIEIIKIYFLNLIH